MSNYIKVSQINKTTSLDSLVEDNSLVSLKTINLDGNIINLLNTCRFTESQNNLPKNTISASILANVPFFASKLTFKDSRGYKKMIYYSFNGMPPTFLNLDNGEMTDNITAYIRYVNNIIITPVLVDESDIIVQDDNTISEILIQNQPLTSLDINVSSIKTLSITNCTSLSSFSCKNFDQIDYFDCSNSSITNTLAVGTLSENPIINLSNNKLNYIKIIGNNSNLSIDNCFLLQQNSLLRYVKFVNCNLTDSLIKQLTDNNVIIEY